MRSLNELCIDHGFKINQILKIISNDDRENLLLKIITKEKGLSISGFLPLKKKFELELELATRQERELDVTAEVIFSSDTYIEGGFSYFRPSKLHPYNYCNVNCTDEPVSIEDILLFQSGGDGNASVEDKKISGADKLKIKTLEVTSSILYIKDFNAKYNLEPASTLLDLAFGLTEEDIKVCLDPKHPHFNIGIPLSIIQWCKNNKKSKFDDTAKTNKTMLHNFIQELVNSNQLSSQPKSGIVTAAAALSASGRVNRGRKKIKN
jgi:hypothetical protein